MSFDELQNAWQSQEPGKRVTLNLDLVLKEVARNQSHFAWSIFWRDVREVSVAWLMTGVFVYTGLRDQCWAWYVCAFTVFAVGLFLLVDRLAQKWKQSAPTDPLKACFERALAQVNHQIWLLENMLWWYLLPPGIGIATVFGYFLWDLRDTWPIGTMVLGGVAVFVGLIFWGVYRLNQYAVRKELLPRRQELEALLKALTE